MHRLTLLLMALSLSSGCETAPPAEQNPLSAPPVSLELIATDVTGWTYRQEVEADLDGDGSPETVILVADVEQSQSGAPLWEDGHRWAVIVRDRGVETMLYSAFVPNGFAEAAILQPSDRGKREVLVQQRSPGELRTFTVRYEGSGRATAGSSAYYQVENWLPGSARLME